MASREREEDAELLVEAIAELGVALFVTFVAPFHKADMEVQKTNMQTVKNRWFRFGRKFVDFMEVAK